MSPADYEIRLALPDDVSVLPQVERVAASLFKPYLEATGLTEDSLNQVNAIADFEQAQQANHLWVAVEASGKVVGFALVLAIGGYAHLDELDVLPAHGRQGLGSALLDTVYGWARKDRYPAVTLRTFRDIPWNGPFYERRGFQIVDSSDLSEAHIELEALEQKRGLRTDLRVAMKRSVK